MALLTNDISGVLNSLVRQIISLVEIYKQNLSHLSVFFAEVDAQGTHGANNGDQRLSCITVDDRLELFVILAGEAAFVNDSICTHV